MTERPFTVVPTPEFGFTDQLMQLSLFGRIGHGLGLRFAYTPIQNARTAAGVWETLGVADAFRERNLAADARVEEVPLSDSILEARGISDGEGLLAAVGEMVGQVAPDAVPAFRLVGQRKLLARLVSTDPQRFTWPDAARIRAALSRTADSPFPDGAGPRVLVHIRRGDVTVVNAPWDRAYKIRPGERFLTQPEPFPTYHLRDFYSVLRRLQDGMGGHGRTAIFSDGCGRAREILETFPDATLGTDANRRRALHDFLDFEDLTFRAFEGMPGTTVDVGETLAGFRKLVRGLIEADLVIYGNAQQLCPKFVGAVAPQGSGKMLAELVHRDRYDPNKLAEAGVQAGQADYWPIFPQDFDLDPVFRFLESRSGTAPDRPARAAR